MLTPRRHPWRTARHNPEQEMTSMNPFNARRWSTLAILGLLAGASSTATRAETPDWSLPTAEIVDLAAPGSWSVALGGEFEYGEVYDGSDDYETELQPGLLAHLRRGDVRYYWEGNTLGVRWTPSADWLLGIGLQNEFGREEADHPALRGLGDTDDELAVTVDVRRGFGEGWPWWLAGRVLAGNSDLGALAVLGVGRELPVPGPRWQADFVLYTTFATSDFQRKDFGVTPAQSVTSGYPRFEPKGGYRALGGQVYLQYAPSKRWLVRAEVGYERYSSDVRDSPIVRASGEFETSLAVLYKLR
jgi:outer membrane scaffolding protein for murein synthesis (MipA/OmpV family)